MDGGRATLAGSFNALSPWMTMDSQSSQLAAPPPDCPPRRVPSPPLHVPLDGSFEEDLQSDAPATRRRRDSLVSNPRRFSSGTGRPLHPRPSMAALQATVRRASLTSAAVTVPAPRRVSLSLSSRGSISVRPDTGTRSLVPDVPETAGDGLPRLSAPGRQTSVLFNMPGAAPSPSTASASGSSYMKDSDSHRVWASVMPQHRSPTKRGPAGFPMRRNVHDESSTSIQDLDRSQKSSPRLDAVRRLQRNSSHYWPPPPLDAKAIAEPQDSEAPADGSDLAGEEDGAPGSFQPLGPLHSDPPDPEDAGEGARCGPAAGLGASSRHLLASGLLAVVSVVWVWVCAALPLPMEVFLAVYAAVMLLSAGDVLALSLRFGASYVASGCLALDAVALLAMALEAWLCLCPSPLQLSPWLWGLLAVKVLAQSRRLVGSALHLLHRALPHCGPEPWRNGMLRRSCLGDHLQVGTLCTVASVALLAALVPLLGEGTSFALRQDNDAMTLSQQLLRQSSKRPNGTRWADDPSFKAIQTFYGADLLFVQVDGNVLWNEQAHSEPFYTKCSLEAGVRICVRHGDEVRSRVACQAVAIGVLLCILCVAHSHTLGLFTALTLALLKGIAELFNVDFLGDNDGSISVVESIANAVDLQLHILQGRIKKVVDHEVALQSAERLNVVAIETAQAKNEFLMAMSHELRTPVVEIIGFVELLMKTSLTNTQRGLLKDVAESADTSLERVDDVLEFSQLVDHSMQLEKEPFSLRLAMEDALKELAPKAAKNQLTVTLHMDPDLPAIVIGDAGQVKQMVSSLVKNAVQSTPTAGDVAVVVKRFAPELLSLTQRQKPAMKTIVDRYHQEPSVPSNGTASPVDWRQRCPNLPNLLSTPLKTQFNSNHNLWPGRNGQAVAWRWLDLYVEVIDTGIGIAPEQHDHVMEPFVQVDQGATREHGGLGLGLAMCKHLAEAMDGAIGIESPLSKPLSPSIHPGTKVFFIISLPFDPEQPPERLTVDTPLFEKLQLWLLIPNPRTRAHVADLLAAVNAPHKAVQFDDLLGEPAKSAARGLVIDLDDCPALPPTDVVAHLEAAGAVMRLYSVTEGPLPPFPLALPKPLRRDSLLGWLRAVAAGGHSPRQLRRFRRLSTTSSCLPGDAGAAADCGEPAGPEPQLLLAEDTPSLQKLISMQLTRLGFKVHVFNHGEELLERLRQQWCPLVVLDYHMPVMDGITCAEEIRRLEREGAFAPNPPVHVVLMTADVLSGTKAKCLEAGINVFLEKPVNFATLQSTLADFVHGP